MTASKAEPRLVSWVIRVPLLAPLTMRDFRLVWLGESISILGDQFHIVALSLLILGRTGSGFTLGVVLIAAAIPRGAFILLGGVLSDRISPRDLALGSNVLRAIVTMLVAGLVLGGRIELWHLAAAGIAFGVVDAVFLPAINTLVPRLVPADRLASANAVLQGAFQLMGTAGPAVAGLAIAVIGIGAVFVLDAVSFALAAYALWLVRSGSRLDPSAPGEPASVASAAQSPSIRSSLADGARVVLGDPIMRSIVVLSIAVNVAFTGPIVVGLPWLVVVRSGGDALSLGLLLAVFSAGVFGGVLIAGSMARPRRFGSVVLGLVLVMGIGLGAIGLASTVPLAALTLLLIGLSVGYVNVVIIAWVQARTDPHVLGRTMSFLMFGSVVAAPISLALAAVLVDHHATVMFLGAGALVVASGLLALLSGLPERMNRVDLPTGGPATMEA